MKSNRSHQPSRCWYLVPLALAFAFAGCDATAPTLADAPAGAFNPQPDPYMEIVRFTIDTPELSGDPSRMRWTGQIADGSVLVATEWAERRGMALHLRQTWTLSQGGDTRTVALSGVFNTQIGLLVLNGDGAHVRATYSLVGGIGVLGGDVMFNPQPDPPVDG